MELQDIVELRVPVLPVRDGGGRISAGVDKGSFFCHEVVHQADSLLDY